MSLDKSYLPSPVRYESTPAYILDPDWHVIEDYPRRLGSFFSTSPVEGHYIRRHKRWEGKFGEIEGKFDTIHWSCEDKDRVMRCAAISTWLIIEQEGEDITDDTPRRHIMYLFSTNDMFADSFSRMYGTESDEEFHNYGRTVEQGAIAEKKTDVVLSFITEEPAKDLLHTLLTSKFTSPEMLQEILSDRVEPYPSPKEDFTKVQRDLHKQESLAYYREALRKVDPDDVKELTIQHCAKNLDMPPDLLPKMYKAAGRALPMSSNAQKFWNNVAGLAFLSETLEQLRESPLNAAIASLCSTAYIEEISPDDNKYALQPPDGKTLEWFLTSEGHEYMLKVCPARSVAQKLFYLELKHHLESAVTAAGIDATATNLHNDAALGMLTVGFSEFKGLLGLIKRIAIGLQTGDLALTTGVKNRIRGLLASRGLIWDFRFGGFIVDPQLESPYITMSRIGQTEAEYKECIASCEDENPAAVEKLLKALKDRQ